MSSDLQRKPGRHLWQRLRIYFRRFRITVLLTLFVLVAVAGYLNQVGLPGFAKRPLLESLRSRGMDLQFTRLRLRGYRGLVADDVRLLGTNNGVLPQFSARSADVKLNYLALARFKLDVRGLTLRGGDIRWQLEATNEPPCELAITNLTAQLRFLPGDEWSLDQLQADCAGARFQAGGRITNATALREWPVFQGRTRRPPEVILARLRRLHDALADVRFIQPPVLRLTLNGDAKRPESFGGSFTVNSTSAMTGWGNVQNAELRALLKPAASNSPHAAELTLTAGHVTTRWASLRGLELNLSATRSPGADVLDCSLALLASGAKDAAVAAESVRLRANWSQSVARAMPVAGMCSLAFSGITSRWAGAESAVATATFKPASAALMADSALGGWAKLLPYELELDCAVTNAAITNGHFQHLGLTALWASPRLILTNLQARLPNGALDANAALDVFTRRLEFAGQARFDFRVLDPVLTEKSRDWLNHFTWQAPPSVEMAGDLTLPSWTNRQPDWRGEVQPGIRLDGAVHLTNASYRGISALAAGSSLSYSNRVWRLPDLALTRPEGTLRIALQSDEISHDYTIKLRGPFDPRMLASQLDEKGRRGLGYFEFTAAPQLDVELCGRWYSPERLGARGSVTWSNFSFRAQHADFLMASLDYTNKVLQVFNPRVERGNQRVTADGLLFDFVANRAWLTNGFTDTDPLAIATAIGPKVAAAVAPYRFFMPPVARVQGVIPLKGESDADLHFDLDGGPFRWMQFNLPHIAGHVCWANESVTLSNVTASFYGGEANGNAWFDVHERGTTPFRFELTATNASLHALMSDLRSPTNRLEGILSGQLVVTDANTADWHTWNGHGHAQLRDGLIWDSPIFGIMSSVMNSIIPGIGNSRASDARGTYTITNSVIHTRDLDIRASGMRLQYDGTVDFTTKVEARVQAELLRDTWIVGKVVSTALWPVSKLFEYKVTGTLAEPKPEPVYFIPRIFLAPLHPFKALKGMFDETPADTNAPPAAVAP